MTPLERKDMPKIIIIAIVVVAVIALVAWYSQ